MNDNNTPGYKLSSCDAMIDEHNLTVRD
jgi:hypothetical protein